MKTSGKKSASRRRRLLAALVALAGAFALSEVLVRAVVFGESDVVRRHGWRLRRAHVYCDPWADEDFWKLQHRFGHVGSLPASAYHPRLGWISGRIDPDTLRHRDFAGPDGRRLVLLYGDSYAHCTTPVEDCFETLLAQSDLGDSHVLLNYGVRGYGLDQIYLLVLQSLPMYAELDPVVIVGLYVDDDLDRSVQSLREWPKPRFRVDGSALALDPEVVPSLERYLAEHPLRARSYAWSALARGLLPRAGFRGSARRESAVREKQDLSRAILDALLRELEARRVEAFFVLFYGEEFVRRPDPGDWRDRLLQDYFAQHRVAYVSARRAILEDARDTGRDVKDYYGHEPGMSGHLNRLGNETALRAMKRGLVGELDDPSAPRRR